MGWCHEFGPQIGAGCDHPMTAAGTECHCVTCGVRCEGRFKGCRAVWARGPTEVRVVAARPARVADDSLVPEVVADAAPLLTPATMGRAPDEMLQSLTGALEVVGAELRAMRAAIDGNGSPKAGGPDAVLDRLAELVDRLPGRVRTVVRETMAESGRDERRGPFGISLRSHPRDRHADPGLSNGRQSGEQETAPPPVEQGTTERAE